VSGLLAWMEGSALAVWTRESPSLLAYPTILTLHSIGLGIVVGAGAVIDLRLLGYARRIPLAALTALFPMIWVAFAVNALSGVILFIADATIKSAQPVFWIKLTCIAAALAVTVRIRRTLQLAGTTSDVPPGRGLAVLSLLFWAAAITAGRLMAYL